MSEKSDKIPRRIVIACHENDKVWAVDLQNELDVPDVMYAIKDIKNQQDVKQFFADFSVTSDIVVYLMTDQTCAWMQQRLSENVMNIHKRGLMVIPLLIGIFNVPFDFFSPFPLLSGSGKMKVLAEKVSKVARNYLKIDFGLISPLNFENLVKGVLKSYRFENIYLTYSDHVDFGYDMMCSFKNEKEEVEDWLVEIKYAKESRFTIRSIDQIIQQDRGHYLANHKLMLVTNGFFTSIMEAYLSATMADKSITIYVVDGWKLRNLIAHNNNLVEEYFPNE